jgi:hypothetical protein
MVADELDLTESQFARQAFVEHINRLSHKLSGDVKQELDKLRRVYKSNDMF